MERKSYMSIKTIEFPCTNYTFVLTPINAGVYRVIARSTRYCSIGRAKKDLGLFIPTHNASTEDILKDFAGRYGLKHKHKAIVVYEFGDDEK